MQINLTTIEQHVEDKLHRIEKVENPAERLSSYRKFLKIETQRLHLRHRFGVGGREIVGVRSLIVDLMIRRMVRSVIEDTGANESSFGNFAIVALGGYGRHELAPNSDIDILFLYQGRKDAERASKLSEAILYLLWDVGFQVGHSVRSLSESISIAREDIVSRNSMIDARLLWGNGEVFEMLQERLEDEIFEKQKRQLLDELLIERMTRHGKFGESACMQEPNVKESAGGLRDLHTLLWAARVAYGSRTLSDLTAKSIVPERDGLAIQTAYDYMLRVRNELHFITGRRTDLLSLDMQQQVAANHGYSDTSELRASEHFMRDYYLQARRLQRFCEVHLVRSVARHEKKRWFSRARTAPAIGGFVMQDGVLELDRSQVEGGQETAPQLEPYRMMLAFSYAQATGASLSSSVQEAIQNSMSRVNRPFRSSPEAVQAFLKMLTVRGKAAAGLRLMHDLDFLGKFLPEFGRITCLVQHDLYHRYTVDEHTIKVIEALDNLVNTRQRSIERYREIYNGIEDPLALNLGLLMHDIGKGLGGGHTEKGIRIAEKVCARLQLPERVSEQVLFLIREHLTMSHIAQRHDLSDERVISDFAARMGTFENLRLLLLLTYADINGVGPGVWNEWKDALIWELYVKAKAILHPEEDGDRDRDQLKDRISRMVASEIEFEEVSDHFNMLPNNYSQFTPAQTIIEHLRLAHTLNSRVVKTSWRLNAQAKCTDLHLCARNRRGLFAAVAGALTAQGINILSVNLNTRADGLAVDSFKVRDAAGEPIADPTRWDQVDQTIQRAMQGEIDLESAVARRLKAQRSSKLRSRKSPLPDGAIISWDNESSGRCSILEVRTADRLGLAYRIASTLSALDLDIVFAKVATEKNLALDIIYVTNAAGSKLADDELTPIEEAIRLALRDQIVTV